MEFTAYLAWVSVAVFVFMVAYRVVKYASMPLSLRWELYPVPHEPKGGGSYMEEVDFVKKPIHSNRVAGLMEMASEVFFLKKVKEHNRFGIWPFSLSMHWGIYLLFLWVLLLVIEAVFKLGFLPTITNVCGKIAFVLGAFGCFTLVLKRAGAKKLALYTAPEDYFNLFFLLAIFVTGIISWSIDPSFAYARAYVKEVTLVQPVPVPLPTVVLLNFVLFELFLLYMPFCKLLHWLGKYFTIDKIIWDDAFKVKDSPADKKVMKQLGYVVTWRGPHIVPGKTWLEEAQIMGGGEN